MKNLVTDLFSILYRNIKAFMLDNESVTRPQLRDISEVSLKFHVLLVKNAFGRTATPGATQTFNFWP